MKKFNELLNRVVFKIHIMHKETNHEIGYKIFTIKDLIKIEITLLLVLNFILKLIKLI